MIEHVSMGVPDLARSGRFFDAALAPLGYVLDPDGHRIEAVCIAR